ASPERSAAVSSSTSRSTPQTPSAFELPTALRLVLRTQPRSVLGRRAGLDACMCPGPPCAVLPLPATQEWGEGRGEGKLFEAPSDTDSLPSRMSSERRPHAVPALTPAR